MNAAYENFSDPQVRFAAPEDAPALADLAAETFPLACPPGTDERDIAEFIEQNLREKHFAAHVTSPHRAVLVYEIDGALVGYALMFDASEERPGPEYGVRGEPSAYLSKCYVRVTSHGGAVAGPLIDAAKHVARTRLGAVSIWLNTNVGNQRAIRFYLKHGFERVGVKAMMVGTAPMEDEVFEAML